MPTINDSTVIDVQNRLDNVIVVSTINKPDGYLFDPGQEDFPYTLQLSFAEIRVINSNSNVFREGFLRFSPDVEKDVYEKLGIRDYKTILTDEDIKDIILYPTKEKLESIIKIQSSSLFERIRGMMIMLENQGKYDISTRVKNLVTARYQELYRGKRKSEIVVQSTITEQKDTTEQEQQAKQEQETDKLKEEIEKLRKLIESMNNQPPKPDTQKKEMAKKENSQGQK